MIKNSISYGDSDGSINTVEGQKRLWDEEKIIYINGIHAFKVIPRENMNPLVELYHEDDGQLFSGEEVIFDVAWLEDLKKLIEKTLDKLNSF